MSIAEINDKHRVALISVAVTVAVIGGGGLMSFANLKSESAEHERRISRIEDKLDAIQITLGDTSSDVKWLMKQAQK